MPPAAIHVIGIDPGGITGWARLTVPRKCLYGNQPSEVLEWDCGLYEGTEIEQSIAIARDMVVLQSLDYKVGPAVVVEDFHLMPKMPSTAREVLSPVRIAAQLQILAAIGKMADSKVVLQHRQIAKKTVTDERLRAWGYWVPGPDHQRDALRIAITALRRARENKQFRDQMWDYDACRT